jgi:hypothetical protein
MSTVGKGQYEYEVIEKWGSLPGGWSFGPVSAVAADSRDRIYAFQRKDPPVLVFDREGNYLNAWGSSAIRDPHGIYIGPDDVVYLPGGAGQTFGHRLRRRRRARPAGGRAVQ